MSKKYLNPLIEKINRVLSRLNQELNTASIEDLVKEGMVMGEIRESITSASKEYKKLPKYLELQTKLNVIEQSYISEAQRRDRKSN